MMKYNNPNSHLSILSRLRLRLEETAPGLVQIIIGPRQVGKTTLLLEISEEMGKRALYVAADSPEASLPGWWDNIWQKAENLADNESRACLLIDEIQNLPGWSQSLKSRYDHIKRNKIPLHIVITGSSALKVGAGAKESMAGRFETMRLMHWSASEIAACFKLTPESAVQQLISWGSYPGSIAFIKDPSRLKDYLRHSIIEPAIGRDLMMTETIRKPGLLRQVFAVCLGHPAEIVSLQKIAGTILEKGSLATVAHYLHLLEEACLIAAVPKYSRREIQKRNAPPKLIALNQALLAAMDSTSKPESANEPDRYGRWVENACIAHAWNAGQKVYYWRSEPHEVDLVIEGSWGKWAIEIKTGQFAARELSGLLEFCRLYKGFKPLVLAKDKNNAAQNAGLDTMNWSEYLLKGL
jgi:uncharacterized protein